MHYHSPSHALRERRSSRTYEKRRGQKKFAEAKELQQRGIGVNAIARQLDIRKATLIAWLAQDAYTDTRGWTKGALRKYSDDCHDRVVALKKERIDKEKYFTGAEYVRMDYAKRYPDDDLPSLWFIEEATRKAGMQTHAPKPPKKTDVVKRQCFPIKSIVTLGRVQQSCDFIGKKYIKGSNIPVSIFSTSYYQWFKMYNIWRTPSESADSVIEKLPAFWVDHPIPDVMRIDNAMTFRGSSRGEAVTLSRFLKFLLNTNVTPLFSSPYRSYTNPHIEGHNRTFTEKLWGKQLFSSMEEIDTACAAFNAEAEEFFRWKFVERLQMKNLRYCDPLKEVVDATLLRTRGKCICFIRFVDIWKEANSEVGIVVLDRFVAVPIAYLNQYVFVVFEIETARLIVYSEYEGVRTEVQKIPFPYN